ncbi:MAG: hypothetical protein WD512_08355, partial [Candidatus Paceibacterota bacterium]
LGNLPMLKFFIEHFFPEELSTEELDSINLDEYKEHKANDIGSAIEVGTTMGQLPAVMYLSSLLDGEKLSDSNFIEIAIENRQYNILAFFLGIGASISKDELNRILPRTTGKIQGLLAAANYFDPNESKLKLKVTPENIQDGKKLIMEMQAKYLAPKILDICISLRDQPLPHLIEILDNSLNHADNMPYHLKSNMMEDCKHFGEGKKQQRKNYKL